jgi:radical SAM-linked protein
MVSAFERAVRRARLPLAFSGGYHPKPKMRFTPALPLGAESRCEFMELGLSQQVSANEVKDRIVEQLPPGLIIKRAELATKSLLKQIRGVHWRAVLPHQERVNAPGASERESTNGRDASLHEIAFQRARERIANGTIKLERKRGAPKDLKAMVLSLERGKSGSIEIKCRFDSGGTLRPAELLERLFGLDRQELEATIVIRWMWLLDHDLELLSLKRRSVRHES